MPAAEEEGKESLQDLLRELLASTSPEEGVPASEEETKAGPEGEGEGPALEQPQVEKMIPVVMEGTPSSGVVAEATIREGVAPQAPVQVEAEAVLVLPEGVLEVKVAPPVPPGRLSLFERALKEREGVVWLGTWGRPGQGLTLRLRLKGPTTPSQLFEGMAVVERLEPAKAGQVGLLKVALAPEGAEAEEAVSASPLAPATPKGQALSEQQAPYVHPEAPGPITAHGQVELEVAPIASLEALNRLERLLSSFSPSCRVANVLSLDGVSTILVTLEGIDGATLTRKLQENIGAIKLEVRADRLVAELPAKW